jgi:putative acetyltransferase
MIRDFEKQDLDKVMELWLETNISAHSFIEKKYWIENFEVVKNIMPNANIYIYEETDVIQGFAGLMDNYIAGIFVSEKLQSKGIGEKLLDYIKSKYSQLSLNVYKNNERAVKFYLREGFLISNEQVDKNTGEIELEMRWEK